MKNCSYILNILDSDIYIKSVRAIFERRIFQMASKNFSVSRVKCFQSCPLQYKYKYVDGWKTSATKKSDDIQKGLALHETFENFPEKLEDAIAFKNVSNMPARVKCALLAWHTIEDILNKNNAK